MRSNGSTSASLSFNRSQLAFPPFEKGGQGEFAVDLLNRKPKQIPLDPPFAKGEKA